MQARQRQMRDKKARERFVLDEFASVCTIFPSGSIEHAESPDFLVSDGSRVTGIEVVDCVRGQDSKGSAYRRNEILSQDIADKARRRFESRRSEPLMVHFQLRPGRLLRKAEIHNLAASAAAIVERYVPQTIFESIRIGSHEYAVTSLRTVISSISVTRVRNAMQASWSFVNTGFISASAEELYDLITSKNTKVPAYLQQCDEAWLLIVADGASISSTVDLSEEIRQTRFLCRFEKVFFYDYQSKRVLSLRTKQ